MNRYIPLDPTHMIVVLVIIVGASILGFAAIFPGEAVAGLYGSALTNVLTVAVMNGRNGARDRADHNA